MHALPLPAHPVVRKRKKRNSRNTPSTRAVVFRCCGRFPGQFKEKLHTEPKRIYIEQKYKPGRTIKVSNDGTVQTGPENRSDADDPKVGQEKDE
jgi:hypothetical protein